MNGLRETLRLLLWHSLSFSQAILHTSQELGAGSFVVRGFPQEARSSSPSSQHPRIASQTRCPVTPAAAPPSPHHFQPGFPRSARHRQSCCISSAHSPATSDTANRFQADVTEQQRSWRQSESINFMGTDYQTRRDIISTIQTVVYHPLLDIRQSVWVRCYKYPRKGRCSIQHK